MPVFGGAQPNISQTVVKKTLLPVPSIEIQKQVADLLDEYELNRNLIEFEATREVTDDLRRYTTIKVGYDKIVQNNSASLEFCQMLRQALLQEAVTGKLVPQDPNDEPASELLKRIRLEKEKLIRANRIRREKLLSSITDEEIPFELPRNWTWTRLGCLGETQTGTTPSTSKSEYFGGNVPFIKPADISGKSIDYNNESLTDEGLKNGRPIPEDSLIMVCIGGSTGKSYFTNRDVSCNQQINAIKGLCGVSGKFLYYFTASPYFQQRVWNQSTGSATNIINKQKWASILFPLPPLKEQERIVKKLDNLLSYCDELTEKVEENQKYSKALMDTVLREAFLSDGCTASYST